MHFLQSMENNRASRGSYRQHGCHALCQLHPRADLAYPSDHLVEPYGHGFRAHSVLDVFEARPRAAHAGRCLVPLARAEGHASLYQRRR